LKQARNRRYPRVGAELHYLIVIIKNTDGILFPKILFEITLRIESIFLIRSSYIFDFITKIKKNKKMLFIYKMINKKRKKRKEKNGANSLEDI
jgi:hypothetical protein